MHLNNIRWVLNTIWMKHELFRPYEGSTSQGELVLRPYNQDGGLCKNGNYLHYISIKDEPPRSHLKPITEKGLYVINKDYKPILEIH